MNRDGLIQCLKMLDANLKKPAKLYIYGGAALMLLEEETRISLDIDVAAPYFDQVRQAVAELPPPFRTDILVLENLEALRVDMHQWRQTT